MALIINLENSDDPYRFSARAVQRTENSWDVEYFREGILVSDGSIGTPPPHMPPMATLISTLGDLRRAADYWAARGGEPADLLPSGWADRGYRPQKSGRRRKDAATGGRR